jgi:hypothetical protein
MRVKPAIVDRVVTGLNTAENVPKVDRDAVPIPTVKQRR